LTESYGSIQSRLGQAFHEFARAKVLGLKVDRESIATRYALTEGELKDIDYGIYNIQIKIPEGAIVIADDKKLTGLNGKITGTPDVAIYYDRILTIPDWKSGWGDVEDPESNNQLLGYAGMALELFEKEKLEVDKIVLLIVQPKLNQVKTAVFTPDQIKARMTDIARIIDEAEDPKAEFTTGPWCSSCFKSMHCPAFAGQVKSLATFIAPEAAIMTTEKALAIMLPLSRACRTVADKVDALAKAYVDINGPLDLGAGQTFVRVITDKKEVDSRIAFETMKEYFPEEEIWKVCSISMEKISELARKTKRGLSTIVSNRLAEVKAITTRMAVQYRIVKGGDRGKIERETAGQGVS
jgi:hypothetical protein